MLSSKAAKKADEAKRVGKWLYDPYYKKWYSPEQFRHIFSYADVTDVFIENLQIRHPIEGVEAGFKRLEAIQNKLQAFTQSVFDYYKKG